jgi:aryl-alcohol dehydrogenase-like predicted oxidoreductase
MGLGGRYDRDTSRDAEAVALIHQALDLGITLFDTAEVYGAGHGEEVLGAALRGCNGQAVIATKFSPKNSSADSVVQACEGSLTRLGRECIDIYQSHWPNPAVPLEETARGLERLWQDGKIRAIGLCNATVASLEALRRLLPDALPIATVQQEYSVIERFVERRWLPQCQNEGMALLAYSPLGQGRLADREPSLQALATDLGMTSAALALAWLCQRPGVIPIPMTFRPENLAANVMAAQAVLSDDIVCQIDSCFHVVIDEIPVSQITVIGSHTGKAFASLQEALDNVLGLSPSPRDVANELSDGEMLKPVKVRPDPENPRRFLLYEGQLRYWGWRIAFNDARPIVAQID